MEASKCDYKPIIKLLLLSGANTNLQNNNSQTAYHLTVNIEIQQLLDCYQYTQQLLEFKNIYTKYP